MEVLDELPPVTIALAEVPRAKVQISLVLEKAFTGLHPLLELQMAPFEVIILHVLDRAAGPFFLVLGAH